ncbi:LysM peptidoglycan-binding domain-containing protein [Granulicatella sp. zg-ZJ]|uniref:LysM peptidoglycan-binding domain-containing protein n=1 Tax=Granulicatella sp. zg-ZJ TaxID=2678504 RepID=UPI0013D6BC24|nr:LysM peptidoglycan-binding domain-containing protein [Granulicatella sp. zg-ZJ]
MEHNEEFEPLETVEQETLEQLEDDTATRVDEPWSHRFEKKERPTTRSAKNHADPEASLYTKIIFVVLAILIVVVLGWIGLKTLGIGKPAGEVTTSPTRVSKLTIQTTTTETTKKSDESATTTTTADNKTTTTTTTATERKETTKANNRGNRSTTTYSVKSGDTLYSLARRFGMTVDEIMSLNGLSSDRLSIGQKLSVYEN